METLAKIVEKISNFRKEWDSTPIDKRLIKSFIFAFILTLTPFLFIAIVMVLFAVALYLPGWAYIMILGIILTIRKIRKKAKNHVVQTASESE